MQCGFDKLHLHHLLSTNHISSLLIPRRLQHTGQPIPDAALPFLRKWREREATRLAKRQALENKPRQVLVESVESVVVAENSGRSVSGVSCDGRRADPSVLLLSALLDTVFESHYFIGVVVTLSPFSLFFFFFLFL